MLAPALSEMKRQSPPAACPLPVPEYLSGYGLAHCLVAAAPMIERARQRVLRGAIALAASYPTAPFDPASIETSLARNLAAPLLQMMGQVVVLELNVARLQGELSGDSAEERFASFVDRLRDPALASALLSEYPVLSEQIAIRLDQWSTFSLEFLRHFCEDWELIRPFFSADSGPLAEIQGGAGDTHCDGRSVMIAGMAGGGRIVYKPRSLAAEVHFQELLGWLNDRGAGPQFRRMKVIDCGDHGWSEFIPAAPCSGEEGLSRFYRRQGGYLAILYAIQACDFFSENLIAAGEHPILIDLEALFHPRLEAARSQRADETAGAALRSSVLATGLLPMRMWAEQDYGGVDISGLGDSAGQLSPNLAPQWEGTNTDEMHMVRRRVEMGGAQNCPTLDGKAVSAVDYTTSIESGFAATYRLLLAHRLELLNMLRRFSVDETRVIVRATRTYGALLHESFHPDLLHAPEDRAAFFDRLRDAPFQHQQLEGLLAAERSDLVRGDIPRFATQPASRDLITSDHEVLTNFFAESGLSLAEERVLQLSDEDLERQLWTIRASLATAQPDAQAPLRDRKTAAPKNFLSAAVAIGDRLAELVYRNGDEATWLGLLPAGERGRVLLPLGGDLYDGLPGIIFFLAYLGKVARDSRYSVLARAALQTLRRQLEPLKTGGAVGAFSGWGGIVYLLAHLSAIWEDSSLLDEAEEFCALLVEGLDRDRTLDVIGGAAGSLLSVLALYRRRPTGAILEAALACGHHLLRTAKQTESGIAWLCGENAQRPLTGFAHGNAGIAYALQKLADISGESRFAQAALQALAYERSLYSPEEQNWPDLRSNATAAFSAAWCHGAPGIGLSRLAFDSEDPALRLDIHAALATTMSQGPRGDHGLCHGDLGNADILLEASEVLRDRRFRARAEAIAAAVLAEEPTLGWQCGAPLSVESPGLMTGLAGIGYAFLRLAVPSRLPSVLALQPPELI